ncbi:MAG TPA: LysM peptidoglycan-binding domain-containing protein [Gaiellales bacterium]|jgi:nucleoid-associated protein YgaU
MADATPSRKATLRPHESPGAPLVEFSFNPTQYTQSASAGWKQTPAKGTAAPKTEFTGTLPETVSFDAFFVDRWAGTKIDVYDVCINLLSLSDPTEESIAKSKPVPPTLFLWWGSAPIFGPCVLKSASIKFTLFDAVGTPTRATASITLEEMLADISKQNPTSGGPPGNRAHVVSDGDSLASIAYREYDDAALWRGLAALNGIDDPMRLRVGQRLLVPPFEQAAAVS